MKCPITMKHSKHINSNCRNSHGNSLKQQRTDLDLNCAWQYVANRCSPLQTTYFFTFHSTELICMAMQRSTWPSRRGDGREKRSGETAVATRPVVGSSSDRTRSHQRAAQKPRPSGPGARPSVTRAYVHPPDGKHSPESCGPRRPPKLRFRRPGPPHRPRPTQRSLTVAEYRLLTLCNWSPRCDDGDERPRGRAVRWHSAARERSAVEAAGDDAEVGRVGNDARLLL
jgi:hypothetical protein